MKKFLLNGVLCAVGLLLVLELFFRFVLPSSEWPRGVVLNTGIRRFDSESISSGEFTYGRYCKGRFSWSINNSGWNSTFDYARESDRDMPMVAILGDSYLEGFYSDIDKHIDVYLTELFEDTVCFYTYAMSGAFLSQYIALMKYEIEPYSPDAYIIFLNSSDVYKSIREPGRRHPYYFQYSLDSLGNYCEVIPDAQSRSKYKDLVLRSAFVRYLRANAQLSLFGQGLADENANQEVPEIIETTGTDIPDDLTDAAEFLLGELNSFNLPVLLVADCPKSWIYEKRAEEAYDDIVALRGLVSRYPNVSLLELADYYKTEYERSNQVFSAPDNPHWNSYANLFIARTLVPSISALISINPELDR